MIHLFPPHDATCIYFIIFSPQLLLSVLLYLLFLSLSSFSLLFLSLSLSLFLRVTEVHRAGQGWGKSLFIAKSELHHDPIRQVQYLKDDCLKFRVASVVLH